MIFFCKYLTDKLIYKVKVFRKTGIGIFSLGRLNNKVKVEELYLILITMDGYQTEILKKNYGLLILNK